MQAEADLIVTEIRRTFRIPPAVQRQYFVGSGESGVVKGSGDGSPPRSDAKRPLIPVT
jgi:hypothetical protein